MYHEVYNRVIGCRMRFSQFFLMIYFLYFIFLLQEDKQAVQNWQFVESLRLWAELVAIHAGSHQLLHSLVHPLVQIIVALVK